MAQNKLFLKPGQLLTFDTGRFFCILCAFLGHALWLSTMELSAVTAVWGSSLGRGNQVQIQSILIWHQAKILLQIYRLIDLGPLTIHKVNG